MVGGSLRPASAEAMKGYLPLCSSMNETLAKLLKKRPVYAASRISQLRKSSSAASQPPLVVESLAGPASLTLRTSHEIGAVSEPISAKLAGSPP